MGATGRRGLLSSLAIAGASLGVGALHAAEEEEEVTPAEDLMREHGVLKRVLLIYDEVGERIQGKRDFPPEAVTKAAAIIRSFIEDYHEKLEEEHLFPRFRKKGKLVDLVDTLEAQHKAGRRLTERITTLAAGGAREDGERIELAAALRQFVRMYAPHEAREDTVLFPAIHDIVSKQEYGALGEDFEKKEHQLFGKEGFEGMVEKVAAIEKELGIHDLHQFTPR
jgi:hemerythrin-like domain-containing protein